MATVQSCLLTARRGVAVVLNITGMVSCMTTSLSCESMLYLFVVFITWLQVFCPCKWIPSIYAYNQTFICTHSHCTHMDFCYRRQWSNSMLLTLRLTGMGDSDWIVCSWPPGWLCHLSGTIRRWRREWHGFNMKLTLNWTAMCTKWLRIWFKNIFQVFVKNLFLNV